VAEEPIHINCVKKIKKSIKLSYRSISTCSKSRRSWDDNIRMDLTEIGWGGVDWIHVAQEMDKWRAVVNSWVP
jgi:hypothetical protein